MKKIWLLLFVLFIAFVFVSHIGYNDNDANECIKVACIGDSNTLSFSEDGKIGNSYPQYLSELLGDSYEVKNYGFPGVTVQEDVAYMDTDSYTNSVKADADILVIMLGTNDILHKRWQDDVSFYNAYNKLLDSYLETEKNTKIYLCTIATTYMKETEEQNYKEKAKRISDIIKKIASERNFEYIDVHAITIEHPTWFEEDGMHFNEDGANGVANLIYQMIISNEDNNNE